jgi:hypothetical protein
MEELQSGMESLRTSIQTDVPFEGVRTMAMEIQRVYEVTVMD